MQRFTFIHDGSAQAWRTAYLAFHVAARLGASLQAMVVDLVADKETLTQWVKQISVGAHAAGVTIETCILPDLSPESIRSNIAVVKGLFIPNHLAPDEETTSRLLETIPCPIWIISEESETRKMAVLIENLVEDDGLVAYAATLSQRMGETLTGLVTAESSPLSTSTGVDIEWMLLQDLSLPTINSALDQLHADLLFMRLSALTTLSGLRCNRVIYIPSLNA